MTIARCFLFVWFFLPLYSYWLFPFALPQLQSQGGSNKSFHFKFWGSGLKAADSPVLLLRITVINLTVVSTVQNPPRAFKPWDLPLGVYKSSTTANSWLPDPKWGAVTPHFIHGKSEMLQNSSTLFALKTLPHTYFVRELSSFSQQQPRNPYCLLQLRYQRIRMIKNGSHSKVQFNTCQISSFPIAFSSAKEPMAWLDRKDVAKGLHILRNNASTEKSIMPPNNIKQVAKLYLSSRNTSIFYSSWSVKG